MATHLKQGQTDSESMCPQAHNSYMYPKKYCLLHSQWRGHDQAAKTQDWGEKKEEKKREFASLKPGLGSDTLPFSLVSVSGLWDNKTEVMSSTCDRELLAAKQNKQTKKPIVQQILSCKNAGKAMFNRTTC